MPRWAGRWQLAAGLAGICAYASSCMPCHVLAATNSSAPCTTWARPCCSWGRSTCCPRPRLCGLGRPPSPPAPPELASPPAGHVRTPQLRCARPFTLPAPRTPAVPPPPLPQPARDAVAARRTGWRLPCAYLHDAHAAGDLAGGVVEQRPLAQFHALHDVACLGVAHAWGCGGLAPGRRRPQARVRAAQRASLRERHMWLTIPLAPAAGLCFQNVNRELICSNPTSSHGVWLAWSHGICPHGTSTALSLQASRGGARAQLANAHLALT